MSLRRQPIRGFHPGVIESGIISLSNGTRDGGDLPKVGAAVRDVSQWPGSKFVMQAPRLASCSRLSACYLYVRGSAAHSEWGKAGQPSGANRPTRFELIVMMRTAKALGLEIPETR